MGDIDAARSQITAHLLQIERLFVARPRITIVIRPTEDEETDIVITNDSFAEVHDALRRASEREGREGAGTR